MKTSVVPAQVTTIEDRIVGSLSLSQVLLLVIPVFIGAALYVGLPPFFHGALYKYAAIVLIALLSSLLAIRIKGKIVMLWILVLAKYNLRPRHIVFNKNTAANREYEQADGIYLEVEPEAPKIKPIARRSRLSIAELSRVESYLDNPAANLSFITTRKGGLSVLITEVKD